MSFSSLLRNASPCHPLRREKEKKGITMLSESFAMREEPPSFLLFPPEGRFPPFPGKGKRKKRRESPFFGAVLPFCRKRGTPPDAESGREGKGKPSPAHRGGSPLAFLSKKGKEEGSVFVLSSFFRHSSTSLSPLLFSCVPSSALF